MSRRKYAVFLALLMFLVSAFSHPVTALGREGVNTDEVHIDVEKAPAEEKAKHSDVIPELSETIEDEANSDESEKIQVEEDKTTEVAPDIPKTEEEEGQADHSEDAPEATSEPNGIAPTAAVATAIYLDGSNGDDAEYGLTKETAVKTFPRAKAIATEQPSIARIYITNTVPIEGDISQTGTEAILIREPDFKGVLLRVDKGADATLSNILVDGNIQSVDVKGSLVEVKGNLTITEGTSLQNNQMGRRSYRSVGGGIRIEGGNVTMTGGDILNNSATLGGGVYLRSGAKFSMSGGAIRYNRTVTGPYMDAPNDAGAGGGVCMVDGATFKMSGSARIQGNTSDEIGGGVSVGNTEVSFGSNIFEMTGGTIEGNVSRATGGGIFVQAAYGSLESYAKITAGSIINNKMLGTGTTNYAFGGGGIYVNGYVSNNFSNGKLYLENVVVTGNNAIEQGGGLAACPISDTRIYLTSGGAIYENTAASNRDDLYILSGLLGWRSHGGHPEYKISKTMLGGQAYEWRHVADGREAELDELSGTLTGEGNTVHLYAGGSADAQTNALAQVFITGNTSRTRGGGIGSNGTVIIGIPSETVDIPVQKEWHEPEGTSPDRPERIEVELWYKVAGSNEEERYMGFESIVPDADGNWKITFEGLPKYDPDGNIYDYRVKERPVAGYESQVTGDQENGYTITNSIPMEIEIPVEKVWVDDDNHDGARPESITVKLFANGVDTDKRLVLNEDNNWSGAFENLPMHEAGEEILYTIEEVSVEGYQSEITGDATTGFTITNTRKVEKITIEGSKTWKDHDNQDGKRPETIRIRLLADGKEVAQKEVSGPEWSWKFEDLDRFNAEGAEIVYTITEDVVEDYSTVVDGYDVTNNHTPGKTSVQVTKSWSDHNNQDGLRPESVTIRLLADGEATGYELTLTAENHWTGTFEDLDVYKDGKKIVYSVEEVPVDGYESSITGEASTGFTVTNIKKPDIPVKPKKPWTRLPKTGVLSSYLNLYGGLLFVAGSALFGIRRKRENLKK